ENAGDEFIYFHDGECNSLSNIYIVVLKEYNTAIESVNTRAVRLLNKISSSEKYLGSIYTAILGFSATLTQQQKEALEKFPEIKYIEKNNLVSIY
ncbi:MAG: hypothetical protein DSZ09_02535, partial [Sulfurovum sp.]